MSANGKKNVKQPAHVSRQREQTVARETDHSRSQASVTIHHRFFGVSPAPQAAHGLASLDRIYENTPAAIAHRAATVSTDGVEPWKSAAADGRTCS